MSPRGSRTGSGRHYHRCRLESRRGDQCQRSRPVVLEDRLRSLATEDELRARLPHLLTLDQWHHPDVLNGDLPSGNERFMQLAELLVTRDAAPHARQLRLRTHTGKTDQKGVFEVSDPSEHGPDQSRGPPLAIYE
jgi:hypothetical protein